MICPTCGRDIPDGSIFCPECGAILGSAAAAPQPKKEQKVSNNPLAKMPLKLVALILTIACAVAFVVSYISVVNTSVENIPIIALVMGDDVDELKEMKGEIGDEIDRFEEACELIEDDLTSKEKKSLEKAADVMKGLSKNFSVNGMKQFAEVMQEIEDIDFIDGYSADGIADEADEILSILDAVTTVVMVVMVFCLILCVLGGLLRSTGLVITGIVFTVLYSLIFCGFLWLVILAAINIAIIVVNKKVKAAAV